MPPQSGALSYAQVYAILRYVGATAQEALILTAIAQGESGHRPTAYNPKPPDNSYGLFQINMIGQMGPERRAWFGIKDNKELFNPGVNAMAALKILRSQGLRAWSVYSSGKYKQYMPAATEAMKYIETQNGNKPPSVAPPEINYTGGGVVMDGAGGGGGGGGGAPPPQLAKNASEAEIVAFIEKHYGWGAVQVLKAEPELRKALIEAAQQGAVGLRFEEYIKKTKWWQSRSETMRTWDLLKITDPKEYKARLGRRVAALKPLWEQYGVNDDITKVAEAYERLGLNEQQLSATVAKSLQKESDESGLDTKTAGAVTADELQRIARMEYLTPIDRQTAERWVIKGVRMGAEMEDMFRQFMGNLANARFGIENASGILPADLFSPVKVAIGEALGIQPDTIDLLDSQYNAVMQVETADGKFRPMTASEAGRWARSTEQYKGTDGAKDVASKLTEKLLQTFGAV